MAFYLSLFTKLTPLYLNIFLGYIAGKHLNAHRDTIARLLFFMISPLIMFNGVLHTEINGSILSLPFVTFFIASLLCITFYRISRKIWDDSSKNIVAFTAGTGNTGYFGLPLALLLFDEKIEGIYIMALLGITLYENSLGYYISAKGKLAPRDCLLNILKLPALYAFFFALFLNLTLCPIPDFFYEFIQHIRGTYTVLGMMIIGIGLAGQSRLQIDPRFIGITFLAKFLAWPLITLAVIFMDKMFIGAYNEDIYQALILLSIVPMAVNTVVMASLMSSQPEKAASTVLLSTLFAIIYIPLMAILFFN